MKMLGPRNRFRPRKSRSPIKGPTFGNEYAALVHARIHNPRLALKGARTFDRLTIVGPTGDRDVDLFKDYRPEYHMTKNYVVISFRTWPETKFEYAFPTLEEADALATSDERLQKGRVKDYLVLRSDDKRMLAKLQEPQLRHLLTSINEKEGSGLPDNISYNELLNKASEVLSRQGVATVSQKILEAYRAKQRAEASAHVSAVAKQTNPTVAKETETMNTATEETATPKKTTRKAPAKAAAKAPAKAAKKTSKGTPATTKGKGKSAKPATNKAESRKVAGDGLGREGTLSRFINERIMKGQGNAEIAAAAAKAFPKSSSTEAKHVAWSRWKLGQNGVKVPAAKE
jgi:hypothetical protein